MKKVYLVQIEEIDDYEVLQDEIELFNNEKDAQNHFQELVKQLKEEYESDLEDWVVDESDNEFIAYEEGYYSQTHISVILSEKEVK
jgi:cell shape-determining protein MreC